MDEKKYIKLVWERDYYGFPEDEAIQPYISSNNVDWKYREQKLKHIHYFFKFVNVDNYREKYNRVEITCPYNSYKNGVKTGCQMKTETLCKY